MNVTLGVPRLTEIINASKTISTPIITAYVGNSPLPGSSESEHPPSQVPRQGRLEDERAHRQGADREDDARRDRAVREGGVRARRLLPLGQARQRGDREAPPRDRRARGAARDPQGLPGPDAARGAARAQGRARRARRQAAHPPARRALGGRRRRGRGRGARGGRRGRGRAAAVLRDAGPQGDAAGRDRAGPADDLGARS